MCIAPANHGSYPLLQAVGLTCCYPNSGQGIQEVSLPLKRGSFTVIAGGRGAGKTTLLRALLGHLPLDAGEIRWHGRPLTSGLVTSMPFTGSAVVDAGNVLAAPRCAYLAQARSKDAHTVREGMACLLESEAELLLVDDLSTVLEAQEECVLWDALFARRLFRRQGACLAVSNRQPALSRADHIVVLSQGRVVGEGRLEALLQTCPEMRRIWTRP